MSIFRGSKIKRSKNFVEPTLVEDKPDAIIIRVGYTDTTMIQTMNSVDPSKLAHCIININIFCGNYDAKESIYWIQKNN